MEIGRNGTSANLPSIKLIDRPVKDESEKQRFMVSLEGLQRLPAQVGESVDLKTYYTLPVRFLPKNAFDYAVWDIICRGHWKYVEKRVCFQTNFSHT